MIAHQDAAPCVNGRKPGPLVWLLDQIGSIWFGVSMLVVIFIYSSIGSAAPPIRQGAMADWTGLEFLRFDKTEMEWFSWWPFQLQIGLFCLAVIIITLRKIPLTVVNAGVWTIHTGIVILALSSAYYFGTKVEGDAAIFQSKALIMAPGLSEPASLIVRPEASIDVAGSGKTYRVSVARMDPTYELLSGPDKGKKTQSIWFEVDSGDRQFTRVVLVGYPDLTEDVIAGPAGTQQRAVKVTGQRLIDNELQIQLGYDVARYFTHSHVMPVHSTGAIYARFRSEDEWVQLRYEDLPHYYEHVAHKDELWQVPGQKPPRAQASLELQPEVPGDAGAIGKLDIRITDYLPYAFMEQRYIDAGTDAPLNPYLRFRLAGTGGEPQELLALSRGQRRVKLMDAFPAEFVWASTEQEKQKAIAQPRPRFVVKVASGNIEREIPLSALQGKGDVAVEGTDYKLDVQEVLSGERFGFDSLWLASVGITKGTEAKYTRVVTAGENGRAMDLGQDRTPHADLKDKDLQITFLDPAQQRLLFVAGPSEDTVDVILTLTDGSYRRETARVGQQVAVAPMVQVIVEQVLARSRPEVRPAIVPRSQRQAQQGKTFSMVRVEVNDGRNIASTWLSFSQHAFDSAQWAQPGRFRWAPRAVRLSDGRTLQLLYSQWRDPLPAPIALDRFVLETHTGGDRPADYISRIRFLENGKWVPENGTVTVKSNHPAQHGDLWFFQAQWDPGTEAHTVLGVGNRNGVHAMLAGVCISIAGMIYAFYIKPIVIRRRKQAALAEARARGKAAKPSTLTQPEVTHV